MAVKLQSSGSPANGLEFKLNGIHKPVSKYVNVVQLMYQSETDQEPQSAFYKVHADSESFKLKNLEPGNR